MIQADAVLTQHGTRNASCTFKTLCVQFIVLCWKKSYFWAFLLFLDRNNVSSWCMQVSSCSAGITNPVAQQGDIATQSVSRFTFVITTTTNLATDSSCTVGLINSLVSPRDLHAELYHMGLCFLHW